MARKFKMNPVGAEFFQHQVFCEKKVLLRAHFESVSPIFGKSSAWLSQRVTKQPLLDKKNCCIRSFYRYPLVYRTSIILRRTNRWMKLENQSSRNIFICQKSIFLSVGEIPFGADSVSICCKALLLLPMPSRGFPLLRPSSMTHALQISMLEKNKNSWWETRQPAAEQWQCFMHLFNFEALPNLAYVPIRTSPLP